MASTTAFEPGWIVAPRFSRRVRALWIDCTVILCIYVGWIVSLDLLLPFHPFVRLGALVLPIVFLEPLLVAWTGGSIGHHVFGLRVYDAESGARIGFVRACVRAFLKGLLGWLSLTFALFAHRGQALHDGWTNSVVVLRSPDAMPQSEKHVPMPHAITEAAMRVPAVRRLLAISGWWLVSTIVFVVATGLVLIGFCDSDNRCGPGAAASLQAFNMLWWASMASIPALGWFGRLYGARARPSST